MCARRHVGHHLRVVKKLNNMYAVCIVVERSRRRMKQPYKRLTENNTYSVRYKWITIHSVFEKYERFAEHYEKSWNWIFIKSRDGFFPHPFFLCPSFETDCKDQTPIEMLERNSFDFSFDTRSLGILLQPIPTPFHTVNTHLCMWVSGGSI